MNFKTQKRAILIGTLTALFVITGILTVYSHKSYQASQNKSLEDRLRGDARSILPHLYLSGNSAWFFSNLEEYKKLGFPCIRVVSQDSTRVWGDERSCRNILPAKNYLDQKVFDIEYDLPEVTILSTVKANAALIISLFLVQGLFLYIAFKFLSKVNKNHADAMLELEKIRSINESNDRLLRLSQTLGHNLKSPVSALKSLYIRTSHLMSGDQKELFSSIQESISSLASRLLNQSDDKPSVDKVLVSEVVSSLTKIKEVELSSFDKVSMSSTMEGDGYIYANAVELSSILSNLVNNSVEAKKKGHHLRIALRVNVDGGSVCIEVEDNGMGIKNEVMPRLFHYGATTKDTGKGCGLFHAREMISSWGGTIEILSKENEFTKVTILLPALADVGREIVLIDDDSLNLMAWEGMAKAHGLSFKGYATPSEFYANLPSSKDAQIYVDYELGEYNGVEVVRSVRSLGFRHVFLATGHERQLAPDLPQVGKDFPFSEERVLQ